MLIKSAAKVSAHVKAMAPSADADAAPPAEDPLEAIGEIATGLLAPGMLALEVLLDFGGLAGCVAFGKIPGACAALATLLSCAAGAGLHPMIPRSKFIKRKAAAGGPPAPKKLPGRFSPSDVCRCPGVFLFFNFTDLFS